MTPEEWTHLARMALIKGAKAAREAQASASDETIKHALEESAEYMEAILDALPQTDRGRAGP